MTGLYNAEDKVYQVNTWGFNITKLKSYLTVLQYKIYWIKLDYFDNIYLNVLWYIYLLYDLYTKNDIFWDR